MTELKWFRRKIQILYTNKKRPTTDKRNYSIERKCTAYSASAQHTAQVHSKSRKGFVNYTLPVLDEKSKEKLSMNF